MEPSANRRAAAAAWPDRAAHLADIRARARADSVEFPPFMANHLPMLLVALDRLGAGPERLEAYFAYYRAAHGLIAIAIPERGRIDARNWRNHLGEREFEADYRAFFANEVKRFGARQAQAIYLPELAPGVAASALHALMRLAYADLTEDADEVGVALGYWAATYLPLGPAGPGNAPTQGPLDILLGLRARLTEPVEEPAIDLLWHWMRDIAKLPAFAPVPGALAVTPDTLAVLCKVSVTLMASTMTFEALHALTGCHWLRLVAPYCPAMPAMLSAFWTAIAAVYPKIGMPLPLDEAALDALRHLPHVPDWPQIAARATESQDEHDISLAFSAREEFALTGDRLYQVIAAKRLELV